MSTQLSRTTADTGGGWPPLARVAAVGFAGFWIAVLVAGALSPGYSHVREEISALAATDAKAPYVMIAGFEACAIGLLCAALALWPRFAGITAGRVAAVMVALGGVAMAVAGLARVDCSEQRAGGCVDSGEAAGASTHYWVHQYVSLLLFVGMAVTFFVLARGLRRSNGWSYLAVPTRILGALLLATTVAFVVVEFGNANGLVQRPYVMLLLGWPILVAGLAPRNTASTPHEPSDVAAGKEPTG